MAVGANISDFEHCMCADNVRGSQPATHLPPSPRVAGVFSLREGPHCGHRDADYSGGAACRKTPNAVGAAHASRPAGGTILMGAHNDGI